MPGHLFCTFGPSNFSVATILNYDIVLHAVPAKIGDQRKFSTETLSFKQEYSSDNHSESSPDEMQLEEDESKRFSLTSWWQFTKGSTST